MQRDFVAIDYQIEFETPFHFGTGLRRSLLDRSVCRDADGYLYVPGSTLKGVLRERCEQIARLFNLCAVSPHDAPGSLAGFRKDVDIVDRVFGSRCRPGELYFDNATMVEDDRKFFDGLQTSKRYIHLQTEERMQTSVSRLLGTAREQALFQSEFGVRTLRFKGRIYGFLEGFHVDSKKWSYSLLLLVAGICAGDRIGANKSTGMGKYDCKINDQKIEINYQKIDVADLLQSLPDLEYYKMAQEEYYTVEQKDG